MPPPHSSGRGGGRGGGGRGVKAKSGATAGISSGRGRGRGRGRGSLNVPGGAAASPKANTNILQISPQHVGLLTEDKPGNMELFKNWFLRNCSWTNWHMLYLSFILIHFNLWFLRSSTKLSKRNVKIT